MFNYLRRNGTNSVIGSVVYFFENLVLAFVFIVSSRKSIELAERWAKKWSAGQ